MDDAIWPEIQLFKQFNYERIKSEVNRRRMHEWNAFLLLRIESSNFLDWVCLCLSNAIPFSITTQYSHPLTSPERNSSISLISFFFLITFDAKLFHSSEETFFETSTLNEWLTFICPIILIQWKEKLLARSAIWLRYQQ